MTSIAYSQYINQGTDNLTLQTLDAIIDVLAKYLQATLPELFEPAA
jgi:hypothetical protein